MKTRNAYGLVAAAAITFMSPAFAVPFTEVGDAGDLVATAQQLGPGTTQIDGILDRRDADLFGFYWGGGSLTIDTVGSTFDTQLFLFDAVGNGIWGNDDAIAFAGAAAIVDPALAAGSYLIGISGFNHDPNDASGSVMFQSFPFEPQYGPNPGVGPLAQWSGFGGGGDYQINFSSPVGPAPVAEPGTLALLGLGLLGLAASRRRRLSA